MFKHGARPLKKIISEGGERYLPVAMAHLIGLHRNSATNLVTNLIVDDAAICVEKTTTYDRITIDAGGGGWFAIATDGLQDIWSRIARSNNPRVRWTEPTKNKNQITPDGFFTLGERVYDSVVRPESFPPLWSLGDPNLFGVALDPLNSSYLSGGGAVTSAYADAVLFKSAKNGEALASFKLAAEYGPSNNYRIGFWGNLHGGEGINYYTIWEHDFRFAQFQPLWLVNELLGGSITLCLMAMGQHKDDGGSPIASGVIMNIYALNPNLISSLYARPKGTQTSDPRYTGGGTPPQIGVVEDLVNARIGFSDYFAPPFLWLSTSNLMVTGILDQNIPDPDARIAYISISTDGGRTFTDYLEANPMVGAMAVDSIVALNSEEALRVGKVITAWHYGTPGGSEPPPIQIDTTELQLQRVTITGDITVLRVLNVANTTDPAHVSGDTWVERAGLIPVGQDSYILSERRVVVMSDGALHYSYFFSRSFDGGLTWDAPNEDAQFEADAFPWNADKLGNRSGDGVAVTSLPPRLVRERMYVRHPHVPGEGGCVIYAPVQKRIYTNLVSFTDGTSESVDMYVSTDLARSFQRQCTIAKAKIYPGYNGVYGYYKVVDSAAPIDPVFPWRVDARVPAPDWW